MKIYKLKKLKLLLCALTIPFISACAVQAAEETVVTQSEEVIVIEETAVAQSEEVIAIEETAVAQSEEIIVIYDAETPRLRTRAEVERASRTEPQRPATEDEIAWIVEGMEETLLELLANGDYDRAELQQQMIDDILSGVVPITFFESFDRNEEIDFGNMIPPFW
ncbi:MAG: hypothetical protein FWG64_14770 [Firmicutes bacterium]|nr:hypothetical protein [Bacillota bacterium]